MLQKNKKQSLNQINLCLWPKIRLSMQVYINLKKKATETEDTKRQFLQMGRYMDRLMNDIFWKAGNMHKYFHHNIDLKQRNKRG